jgi:hypothetical protein
MNANSQPAEAMHEENFKEFSAFVKILTKVVFVPADVQFRQYNSSPTNVRRSIDRSS